LAATWALLTWCAYLLSVALVDRLARLVDALGDLVPVLVGGENGLLLQLIQKSHGVAPRDGRCHDRRRVVQRVGVVAVVGPTAAGKSDLAGGARPTARGEVVNADSMQLYRGMDIGTAKLGVRRASRRAPSPAGRAGRH
jgi:hypothetical protein